MKQAMCRPEPASTRQPAESQSCSSGWSTQVQTCTCSLAAVLVQRLMRSLLALRLTTRPQMSSPSANCSPMHASNCDTQRPVSSTETSCCDPSLAACTLAMAHSRKNVLNDCLEALLTPSSQCLSSSAFASLPFAMLMVHCPPLTFIGSSHFGSMPLLNKWKSDPVGSQLGGLILLNKLQSRQEKRMSGAQ